jgi:hypothetical protein
MRVRGIAIAVLVVQIAGGCLLAYGATQKRAVTGASSSIPDVMLHLENKYCDKAWPYVYVDNGYRKNPDSPTDRTVTAAKVDDHINFSPGAPTESNPLTIEDPGSSILGQVNVELAPDGSDAARLLVRTLAGSPEFTPCTDQPPSKAGKASPHFSFANAAYYLIDIVRWQAVVTGSKASYQVAADNWYLFNFSDPKASRRKFPFTFRPFVTSDLRIFGDAAHPDKTNVVFLAVNLAPQDDWDGWSTKVDVSYKLHADKVIPANIQDLQLLISFLVGRTSAPPPQQPGAKNEELAPLPQFQGRYAAAFVANLGDLPAKLTSTMTATFNGGPKKAEPPYCAEVTKTLLTAAGKPAGRCSSPSTTTTDIPAGGATEHDKKSSISLPDEPRSQFVLTSYGLPPANRTTKYISQAQEVGTSSATPVSAAAGTSSTGDTNLTKSPQSTAVSNCDPSTTKDPGNGVTVQKACTLTQTITDEGLYHWDVSIAVPITGYKETVFDSNNALMPKSVTRTNAYAMLDIAPWGEDFVKPQLFGIPHLMTGLPLSGKVFNKPFVGGLGEEVGLTKLLPFSARLFAGVVYNKEFRGASQVPHRVWKVQYGIELSMSSAISKLKSGSTTKTNSSGAGK